VTSVTAPSPWPGYDTGRESLTVLQRELKNGGELLPISGPVLTGCGIDGQRGRRDPKMTSRKRSEEVE
jgi:hypothetical protein